MRLKYVLLLVVVVVVFSVVMLWQLYSYCLQFVHFMFNPNLLSVYNLTLITSFNFVMQGCIFLLLLPIYFTSIEQESSNDYINSFLDDCIRGNKSVSPAVILGWSNSAAGIRTHDLRVSSLAFYHYTTVPVFIDFVYRFRFYVWMNSFLLGIIIISLFPPVLESIITYSI